jgi:hypothetical protein
VKVGEPAEVLAVKPANLLFVSVPAADIFISGVTGPNSEIVNGFYSPSQERGSDGRTLYVKSDDDDEDDSVCIEHMSHTEGVWQVKRLSRKGTDYCFAGLQGGCPLEACTSRVWIVASGGQANEMPSVKMLIGGEAKRAVSHLTSKLTL